MYALQLPAAAPRAATAGRVRLDHHRPVEVPSSTSRAAISIWRRRVRSLDR